MKQTRTLIVLLLSSALLAQTKKSAPKPAAPSPASEPALSPVGHWVAQANPNNDLQLWWDFHADGTLTVTAGATARTTYKLAGHILTVGVSSPRQPAGVFEIRFGPGPTGNKADKLFQTPRAANPPTLEFTRIGTQRFDSAPLVGKWRITDAPHAADPRQEQIRNRLARTVTAYNSDGTYEARVAIDATQGTWSAATHSYTLRGYSTPYPFERKAGTLTLSSPVGPTGAHIYVSDKFF